MPKFVFAYHGGSKPNPPDDIEKIMAAWSTWLNGLGDAVIDGGNPVGPSSTVFADKVEDHGGANPLSGYSLVNAKSVEAAIEMAKGCPALVNGGNVEVAQAMDM